MKRTIGFVFGWMIVGFCGGQGTDLWELGKANRDTLAVSTLFSAQDVQRHLSSDEGIDKAIAWCKATGVTRVFIEEYRDKYWAERAAIDALRHSLLARPERSEVVIEIGEPLRWTKEVGFLNDLVIIERVFDDKPASVASDPHVARPSPTVKAIVEQLDRPILVIGSAEGQPFPGRVLVVHDTRRRLDEAVFIAAYLAERWGAELTVLPLSNGRNTAEVVAGISQYLALHEVTATFLEPVHPDQRAVEPVIQVAEAGAFDLLLLTGPDRGRKTNRHNYMKDVVWDLLQRWQHSTLIAT